jgi:TonB-dependent SusC/RagA subfamily outer membrane receptor
MKFLKILSVIILLCFYSNSSGQKTTGKITISGTVLDANRKPIENAAIFIDKIKTNSVTDRKGYYKIKTSSEAKVIMVFSLFNGLSETAIDGRTSIDFILTGEATESDRINTKNDDETVNTGYGSVRKSEMTNNVSKIDGQNPRFAAYSDIYDMLRGTVPGVDVSGHSIKIAGSSSLNISTEPLFVLDGVIVNSIEDIAPQSVKSIEVLKGAAASVYGTRGANGVILITRFSGKE